MLLGTTMRKQLKELVATLHLISGRLELEKQSFNITNMHSLYRMTPVPEQTLPMLYSLCSKTHF